MDGLYHLRSRQTLSVERCPVLATIQLKIIDKINSNIKIQNSTLTARFPVKAKQ